MKLTNQKYPDYQRTLFSKRRFFSWNGASVLFFYGLKIAPLFLLHMEQVFCDLDH